MEPHLLIFDLYNAILRKLSVETHFAGLHAAGRHLRKKGVISDKQCRRLAHLDLAYHVVRHITPAFCDAMVREFVDVADGSDGSGFDKQGYDRHGYSKQGFDRSGFDKHGFDEHGYDKKGFNASGFDRHGYNVHGFDRHGYKKDGFDEHGYDEHGYDRHGYNKLGLDRSGLDKRGFDEHGYDKEGFDASGFDKHGYNKLGADQHGYKKDELPLDFYSTVTRWKDCVLAAGWPSVGSPEEIAAARALVESQCADYVGKPPNDICDGFLHNAIEEIIAVVCKKKDESHDEPPLKTPRRSHEPDAPAVKRDLQRVQRLMAPNNKSTSSHKKTKKQRGNDAPLSKKPDGRYSTT